MAGYRVAAKTGTSEKKNAGKEGMYICSTVAYAPADDPEIAMIIIVDEPTQGVLYGSVVAAPYVAAALENIMPYLGVEARYTDAELAKKAVKVGSYANWSLASAQEAITKAGLTYRVVGSGDTVKRQTPAAGTTIERTSGCIVLYLGDAKPSDSVEVPDLMGKTAIYATQSLVNLGLNVRIVGSSSYLSGTGARVCAQSVAAGTMVPAGTVITITFYEEGSEGADY